MTDRSVLGEHHDDAILRFSSKLPMRRKVTSTSL
jgi:hypothetical protein